MVAEALALGLGIETEGGADDARWDGSPLARQDDGDELVVEELERSVQSCRNKRST